MEVWLAVTLCAAAFVVGAAIFGFVMYKMGIEHRKKTAEAQRCRAIYEKPATMAVTGFSIKRYHRNYKKSECNYRTWKDPVISMVLAQQEVLISNCTIQNCNTCNHITQAV